MKIQLKLLAIGLLSVVALNNSTSAMMADKAYRKRLKERDPLSYHPKLLSYHPLKLAAFPEETPIKFIAKVNDIEAWENARVLASEPAIKCSAKNEWVAPFNATKSQVSALLDQPFVISVIMLKNNDDLQRSYIFQESGVEACREQLIESYKALDGLYTR